MSDIELLLMANFIVIFVALLISLVACTYSICYIAFFYEDPVIENKIPPSPPPIPIAYEDADTEVSTVIPVLSTWDEETSPWYISR